MAPTNTSCSLMIGQRFLHFPRYHKYICKCYKILKIGRELFLTENLRNFRNLIQRHFLEFLFLRITFSAHDSFYHFLKSLLKYMCLNITTIPFFFSFLFSYYNNCIFLKLCFSNTTSETLIDHSFRCVIYTLYQTYQYLLDP